MDYGYEYSSMDIGADAAAGMFGALAGMMMVVWVVCMALCVVYAIAMWKVFVKAGRPGWACLVPFYGSYVLFDIGLGNGWLFLTCLIPFVNIYFLFKLYINIAHQFGYSTAFGIGLIFVTPVFLCILGFGKSTYGGSNSGYTVRKPSGPYVDPQMPAGNVQDERAAALERMRAQRAARDNQ